MSGDSNGAKDHSTLPSTQLMFVVLIKFYKCSSGVQVVCKCIA